MCQKCHGFGGESCPSKEKICTFSRHIQKKICMEGTSSSYTSDHQVLPSSPFPSFPVSTEDTQPSTVSTDNTSTTFILPSEIGSIQVLTSKAFHSHFLDKKVSKPKSRSNKRTMSEMYSTSSSSHNSQKKTQEFTKRRILELGCNWFGMFKNFFTLE